jgi:glycosyltransferase involved in cell wall biosynthesis
MKLTFLLVSQDKPYEGVVRPFSNFAKGIKKQHDISFAMFKCSESLKEHFQNNFDSVIASNNKEQLIKEILKNKTDMIFCDDDPQRLNFLLELTDKTHSYSCCYSQILYGCHSIASSFDLSTLPFKENLIYSFTKYVPFYFFSRKYSKLLKKCSKVIANSNQTAAFLQSIYNVEFNGIVYPSIDNTIFDYSNAERELNQVVLYLGSHLGDVNITLINSIVNQLVNKKIRCMLFGNKSVASIIKQNSIRANGNVIYNGGLSDQMLAQLYSQSSLTICPQKWETFGLVPVESMSCGTPVLAFNSMGSQETIIDGKTGWLANNSADFIQKLDLSFDKHINPEICRDNSFRFSIEASSRALGKILS